VQISKPINVHESDIPKLSKLLELSEPQAAV
jgi:hypothetical protein